MIIDEADALISAAKSEGREISFDNALEIIKIQKLQSIANHTGITDNRD